MVAFYLSEAGSLHQYVAQLQALQENKKHVETDSAASDTLVGHRSSIISVPLFVVMEFFFTSLSLDEWDFLQ